MKPIPESTPPTQQHANHHPPESTTTRAATVPPELELACTLHGTDFAARKSRITQELFTHVDRVEELPDGFAYRLPSAEHWTQPILDFIAVERECCPFLTFEIACEPHNGPVWLRLRGSTAIKAFIETELGDIAPRAVTSA